MLEIFEGFAKIGKDLAKMANICDEQLLYPFRYKTLVEWQTAAV